MGDLVLQPELTPAGLGSLRVLVDDSNTTVWLPGHPLDLSAPVITLTEVADDDDSVDSEDREYQVLDIFLHQLGRTLQGYRYQSKLRLRNIDISSSSRLAVGSTVG